MTPEIIKLQEEQRLAQQVALMQQYPQLFGKAPPKPKPTIQETMKLPTHANSFSKINPMYTGAMNAPAQQTDSFAPMRMLQLYRQTGQLPQSSAPSAPAGRAGPTMPGGK